MFRYKKRTLGVLFLILEAVSFILDQYGGSHLGFLVASVFISLVGFLITGYNFTKSRSDVENELNVIELVFSIAQLIVTCICFISTTLEVKLKLNASVFPLVLAITAVALAFKNNEQVTNSSIIQSQLVSSNTSMVVVDIELTNSLSPHIQGVSSDTPTVVDEEDITDSSAALLLHVASSNASAVVDDEVEESTDLRAPLISSNTPTMSDDEEISRTSTPRWWFDVDEEELEINKIMFPRMLRLRPCMTSAQSNLWQSTKDLRNEEEKEQCSSPVSVLDCTSEDDETNVTSPFHQRLARMEGTKQKHMQRRFESLARLEPVDLEKRIASSESDNDDSIETPIQSNKENETEKKAEELLKQIKSTSSSNNTLLSKADNLLSDFFIEMIEENQNDDSYMLKAAGDWIEEKSDQMLVGWEVGGREACLRDMETNNVRWENVDEEKQDFGLALESEVFTCLVNELCMI
ncbi:hypothetical protein EZV62_012664 [Acer yangbiense]|uniref:DUF4378 domain-containing protein n=1 Tax=Acer yangbiense TaxID=1000413 RepID=A0A5C7HW01_9ROSI|nr:hypothetical protein EZV62_012664 [Acer yangbiense]